VKPLLFVRSVGFPKLYALAVAAMWWNVNCVSAQVSLESHAINLRPPADRQAEQPALAVLMIAYEGAKTGQNRAHPELVAAMKKAIAETPGASRTFDKFLRGYKALTPDQRAALVGRELALASPATRLAPALVRQAFASTRPMTLARELEPATLQVVHRRPGAAVPERERRTAEAQHPRGQPPGISLGRKDERTLGDAPAFETGATISGSGRNQLPSHATDSAQDTPSPPSHPPLRDRLRDQLGERLANRGVPQSGGGMGSRQGKRPPAPDDISVQVTKYVLKYKGLYCWNEDDDWGTACEPYVIFSMTADGRQWCNRAGPYDDVDAGEGRSRNATLFVWSRAEGSTKKLSPLTITASCWENDSLDPDDVMNALHVALLVAGAAGCSVPPGTEWVISQLLPYLLALLPEDEDEMVPPEAITVRIDEDFIHRHVGKNLAEKGFHYDLRFLFQGRPGTFTVYLDLQQQVVHDVIDESHQGYHDPDDRPPSPR